MTESGVMHEVGYVYSKIAHSFTSHLDNYFLSIFHYLGCPLGLRYLKLCLIGLLSLEYRILLNFSISIKDLSTYRY